MAKIVILYVTELGCNHTHLALSDYGGDRGLHTEGFFIGILCLNAKRSEMSAGWCSPEIN